MVNAVFKIKRKCKECGREFFIKKLDSLFCSRRCSKNSQKKRMREIEHEMYLEEIANSIPADTELLSIAQASAVFQVSIPTIYRLGRKGKISVIKTKGHKSLVRKDELHKIFPMRKEIKTNPPKLVKLYNMEPENCYTVGEVYQKYKVSGATLYEHIRRYSIPTRQIGNYVYIPKEEIDNLYKSL